MGIISRTRAAIGRIRNFDPEMAYLNEATSRADLLVWEDHLTDPVPSVQGLH